MANKDTNQLSFDFENAGFLPCTSEKGTRVENTGATNKHIFRVPLLLLVVLSIIGLSVDRACLAMAPEIQTFLTNQALLSPIKSEVKTTSSAWKSKLNRYKDLAVEQLIKITVNSIAGYLITLGKTHAIPIVINLWHHGKP